MNNIKIVFAHNVYNRFKTLKETVLIEKKFFPESYSSIAYNDTPPLLNDVNGIILDSFKQKQHKIGCVNGLILSIKNLLEYNFDILVFSHDDVRIDDINVFNLNIHDMLENKFDIIYRTPKEYGENYALLECFFITKNAATILFKTLELLDSEKNIPYDNNNSISPEVWFDDLIKKHNLKNKIITYSTINTNSTIMYNNELSKTMGFIHLNAGLRGWVD